MLGACFEFAGICGIEPWRFTYGQLSLMARARMTHDWDGTSDLWAIIANTVRDPKKRPEPYLPTDRHPYRYKHPQQPIKSDISVLKLLLNRNGNSKRNPSG